MATVVVDNLALLALLRSPSGGVAQDLLRRARKVEARAVRLCPVDTGELRSSITHSLVQTSRGLAARVGTNVEYALYVEEGTKAHVIRARNKRALAFVWPNAPGPVAAGRKKVSRRGKRGPLVFFKHVNHPGTRGTHFLAQALAEFQP